MSFYFTPEIEEPENYHKEKGTTLFIKSFSIYERSVYMEGLTSIQIVLLGLGGIGILVVIIFLIRVNDKGYDYDRILRELNEQQEKDLEELNAGNKEIDKIESEILKCKKKLGMKLFDK